MIKCKVLAVVEARVVTGPAKNILRFAAANRDRVDVTVVTFARRTDNRASLVDNQFVSTARSKGLAVEIIPERGPFDLSVNAALRQICDRHRPDIVQTHAVKSHFILSLLRNKPFRWIAFHHGYTNEDLKMRFYNHCDRWSLRTPDLVVTVCREFARQLAAQGVRPDAIVVVPNAVPSDFNDGDAALSAQTRALWKISDSERVVLAVGRLSPEKGHRYLVDAVARMASNEPELPFQVLIAGAGQCEERLKEQIRSLGLDRRIKVIGYCSDVKPLFLIADLFVLPSLSEGSPNVLLESVAARVPIVASNVGGVPELVTDMESALLVPPANAEALARSIRALLFDRPRAEHLAKAAVERARLMFTSELYDQRVLDLYARAVSRGRMEKIH
jgi:glycosyltransferase involved in cell wall biosynthesis